jgi:hypothetical protein
MRKVSWFAGCVPLLGLGLNVASADVVTVNLTGHVTSVNDPSSAITVGEPVTATYRAGMPPITLPQRSWRDALIDIRLDVVHR